LYFFSDSGTDISFFHALLLSSHFSASEYRNVMAITKWSPQGRLTKEEQAESHSDARGNKMSANDCIFDREAASERASAGELAGGEL